MCPAAPGRAGLSSAPAGEAVPIRPLGSRELLDLPFAVIQADIRVFAGLIAPVLAGAVGAVVAITAAGSAATAGSDAGTAWAAILSTAVCVLLLRFYVRGVATPVAWARITGGALGWRAALREFTSRVRPLLSFQAGYTLTGVGVLLLGAPLLITLLPAVVWLGRLRATRCTTVPVLFAENAPYRIAATRAKVLAAGGEWQLAGIWLYHRGLLAVLVVPLLGIPLFLSDFSGTHRWAMITLTVTVVLTLATFAELVDSTTRLVAYVDRRCRREAWDIVLPQGGPTR
ncbi:hypothetical protein ACFYTQ_09160 [Nocardia sp. NPDC004068]|uniref:hypothetical protein n=1 Tax=Nocardia sp. NPDC004068 TaxID=3364303 RepID=UPI00367E1F86